jgi:hypothetical protein
VAEAQEFETRDQVVTRLAGVVADAMRMARPGRLEHEAAAGVLVALAGGQPPPEGLDARPVLRWTVHCSHCGGPYREPEYDQVAVWPTHCLPTLADFGLGDQDWRVNEFPGMPVVCPACACVAWCEKCREQIRVWEPHWSELSAFYHTRCVSEPDSVEVDRG